MRRIKSVSPPNGFDTPVHCNASVLEFLYPPPDYEVDEGARMAHAATDYSNWRQASAPYEVPFAFPYEPYVVVRRATVPRYDTRYVGYGNDKVQHAISMGKAGFKFKVVPEAFVIHVDHQPGEWQKEKGLSVRVRVALFSIR
jgi:hypothetical protein